MTVVAQTWETPTSPHVRVRFEPDIIGRIVRKVPAPNERTQSVLVEAYSPWIVHPWGVTAPAIHSGGQPGRQVWQFGNLSVWFESPMMGQLGVGYSQTIRQPRHVPPAS
jgi:hypothetical protein